MGGFAADLDVAHPYVSPLNGDFHGLAPMIVFFGTPDLFYPDLHRSGCKGAQRVCRWSFICGNASHTNYAAMPTPAGRKNTGGDSPTPWKT